MSLPPQLIRVKRKLTEDEPLSFLRVQEHKRHVTEAFVYQRQKQDAAFADIPLSVQKPVIHTSETRRDGVPFQSPRDKTTTESLGEGSIKDQTPLPADVFDSSKPEPRRFHMSRVDMMLATSNYPSLRSHAGISKKRSAPALFVERKIKRLPSTTFKSIAHGLDSKTVREVPAESASPVPTKPTESMEMGGSESRKLKKPGLAKQTQRDGTPKKAELPTSLTNRWDTDLDQLTADMNAFAMQQIGLELQRAEEEKQRREKVTQRPSRLIPNVQSPPRFKPKAPAKRYTERHPEKAPASLAIDQEMEDPQAEASETDEEDYVIETYVRVPASAMKNQQIAPQKVGLLVFDGEPDLEFFYGGNDDSDDEWAEDDEDENAENYYTADYPDEEVASDDEFGYNAYAYRTGNASDLEEHDAIGYQDSGPDEDSDDKDGFKSYIGKDGRLRKHL